MKKKLIQRYQYGNQILIINPTKGRVERQEDTVLWYPEGGGDPTSFTVNEWNEQVRLFNEQQKQTSEAIEGAKKKYFEEHPEDIGKTRFGEFAYRPVRYAEGVDPYIDTYTGEPILNGQNILTRNGEVVTTKSQDWLDWLAETNQILPGQDLPELIVHAVPTGKKSFYQYNTIGDDYDEYAERKQNAPIATTKQWEQIKEKEADENFISTPIGHKIWLRQKDEEAREKTPGVGSLVVAPTLLGLGATALMYNPIALPLSLLGARVGEVTADYPFQQQGYGSFGDWLFQGTNAPKWLKENSNPGLWLGGGAGWSIGKGLERGLGIKLLKRPTLLSDTYENRWDLEDILYEREQERLANASANNYLPAIPNAVQDVEAIELSSSVPKVVTSVKRPGVFYSKVGETNEGSVFSQAAKALKDKFKKAFGNDPVWNLMERAGIPEEQRGSVEISLFGKNIPDQNNVWIDPMTGFRQPIAAPNMTDEEIIKVFSEGASQQLKRLKSPEFKALVQKEMGWGDTEYNELMQEINNRLKDGHSIKVRGINELQQGYVANTNILPDGSVIYTINRDRFAATPFDPIISLKSSGAHEFYHGLTGGIRGTNQVQGATQSMLAKKYPRLAQIMDHNDDLVKTFEFNEWANYFANTPKHQIVQDLRNAGFTEKQIEEAVEINIPRANSFKNYINSNQETAARSTTAAKYGPDSSDYDDLAQFYTQESLDQSGRLLSKIGEINEGSLLTAIKNGIREVQKELITPKTFTKFPSIEILRAQRAAESLGLIDRAKQLAKLYEDKVIIEKYGKNAIVKENAKRISDKMWDEQYFQAIKNIDVDEAQRLRDLHFYAKTGIEPITRYHGSPSPYNKWSHLGFSDFGSDPFHHFATLEEIAAGFGPTRKFYLNIQNPVRVKDQGAVWHPYNLGKELHKNVPYKTPVKYDQFTYNDSKERYTYEVMKDYLGTDGLVYDNIYEGGGDSFAIPDSRFAKLADAVTFDDSGNIIPLSKRDDFNTRNILYSKIGEVNKGSVVGASRRPILRKNMHEFSDAEWDAAYEAALEKGNKREMWRLLTLRFQQKAKEYIANGGGDPKVLFRGDWRDYFLKFKKDGVWLSSDPVYALNFTEDKIARDHVLFPSKVRKYFVKGTSEQLLPKNVYYEITPGLPKSDYYWDPITDYLMFGVPDELRRYATMNNAENNLRKILGKPLKQLTAAQKKAHKLGSADVIFGQDSPVHGCPYWHNSQGLEYNVANPNYVKSANLITYDDAGNMIPLSQRFNFGRNDRRYSWLIPLLPFLYPNKKDQSE